MNYMRTRFEADAGKGCNIPIIANEYREPDDRADVCSGCGQSPAQCECTVDQQSFDSAQDRHHTRPALQIVHPTADFITTRFERVS